MSRTILIAGGGFGGVAAAHRLAELVGEGVRIVLVDRQPDFVMGFAKLWDLAGTRPLSEGTRPLANLAQHGVEVVEAAITAIDADARTLTTTAGTFEGDALLLALGAASSPRHVAMLAHERAHNLYEIDELAAIRRDLATIEEGRVGICILGGPHKCPPAPYETALIVDGLLRERGVRDQVDVVLTTPAPITLPVAGPDASKYIADRLGDHGVALHAEHRVTAVDELRVEFDGHPGQEFDLVIAVPANVAPAVLSDHALIGPSGWIEVDRHSFRTTVDGVWAVGDCTMVPTTTGQLPMAGVFAAAGGIAAAEDIARGFGVGDGPSYDGHGFCFLELPGEQVAFVEGNFYADPPQVVLTDADHEQFLRKQAYERERLDLWLPTPS